MILFIIYLLMKGPKHWTDSVVHSVWWLDLVRCVYHLYSDVFLYMPTWWCIVHTMCSSIILSLPSLVSTLFWRASSALHSSTVTRSLFFCTSIFKWIKWYGASVWRSYIPTGAINKNRNITIHPLPQCEVTANKLSNN